MKPLLSAGSPQSGRIALRLVDAGARLVAVAGFPAHSRDTPVKNGEGHPDRLCPLRGRTPFAISPPSAEGAQLTSRAKSRGDRFATIDKAFGIDWNKEYDTPIGRPIKIANSLGDQTGQPLTELL